ncbi:asparagine synthase (glutamine-hydrolyzing) [Tistrella sp. BH-R2-4]|uniref:asparagine synthase (glutamine-hydrolyzing) n=1 Tax=Tistrella arctica TaxID=3133430 RepID=A0ABU9YIK8_9PROT
MCGIAGIMTRDGQPPTRAVLDRLAGAMGHRGPDGHGVTLRGGVGLVHTRLAIIDLATGDQPLLWPIDPADRNAVQSGDHARSLALVANGEIYNYRELKASLPDARFRTASDCEPPLPLYLRHGTEGFDRLRGMYAIALHDPRGSGDGRLVLARDPFGIKPLYYVEGHEGFAFASEPAVLIRAGLAGTALDDARIIELLQLHFTTGAGTVFPAIRRVLPGERLIVEAGRITDRRVAPALPGGDARSEPDPGRGMDAALAAFDRVFEQTIDLHQRSDVPYGLFLSGGVDSSAVLAMMARLNSRPVTAFTAGFGDGGVHDERAAARVVAGVTGADLIETLVTRADFDRIAPQVARALDDPTLDYAVLPSFKLAEIARAHVKVVLSGEGGDELFAGYGRYRRARRWRLFGGRPMRRRGDLDGTGLLRPEWSATADDWRHGVAAAEAAAARAGGTRLQRLQAVDCADWLPNDLLLKLDRMLMANGIEGRTPFLDPAMAAFAWPLPDRMKVDRRRGKLLLRHWLARHLPQATPFAPKRGFTVPVGAWIAADAARLGPLVADEPLIARLSPRDAVIDLFRAADRPGQGQRAWGLLMLALWHRIQVNGAVPGPDIASTLAGQ